MILKITKDHPAFDSITDDWDGFTCRKHRRGSTFFTKRLYECNEEFYPEYPELWGFWESNLIVDHTEYGTEDEINELTRVEQVAVTTYEWKPVSTS